MPSCRLIEEGASPLFLFLPLAASYVIIAVTGVNVIWMEKRMKTFTAYIEWDPETKLYVGTVPTVPGAHTQGASLDELHKNLKEVLELCLEEIRESGEMANLPQFSGLQQIEIAV